MLSTAPDYDQCGRMARTRLYITEHMNAAGISDRAIGKKLGIHRITVLRMRQKPERLRVEQLQGIAEALGLEDWKELTFPPNPADKLAMVAAEANEALAQFRSGKK